MEDVEVLGIKPKPFTLLMPCSVLHTGEAMVAIAYCAVSGPCSLSRLLF